MPTVSKSDEKLRGVLTQMIAELGRCPEMQVLPERVSLSVSEAETSLQRLHTACTLGFRQRLVRRLCQNALAQTNTVRD